MNSNRAPATDPPILQLENYTPQDAGRIRRRASQTAIHSGAHRSFGRRLRRRWICDHRNRTSVFARPVEAGERSGQRIVPP
jgi:hypothetical protein